jgi:vacuolar-type H+-ATPase subunit F/Vma7
MKTTRKTVTIVEVCKMVAKKCHRKIYSTTQSQSKPMVCLLRKKTGEERRMELWT